MQKFLCIVYNVIFLLNIIVIDVQLNRFDTKINIATLMEIEAPTNKICKIVSAYSMRFENHLSIQTSPISCHIRDVSQNRCTQFFYMGMTSH